VLQGKKWKYDVAAAEIISHNDWKLTTTFDYDPIKELLNAGVIYGNGRDKSMRPIIIVSCEKIL
jgi:hypothetical protein